MSEDLERVLKQLADEGRPVRTIDLGYLSDLPRSETARFVAAWMGLSSARRLDLLNAMVDQAQANIHLNFHTILRECLSDADARVRKLAVDGLWEDERPGLIGRLVALLAEDPAPDVRAAAASSLGRFVLMGVLGEIAETLSREAEQALRAAWYRPHEVTEVRRRALESLAYLGDPDVFDLIDNAYYDEDELMRQSAVFAMGRSADRRWAKLVMAELRSRDAAMRSEAAASAGELGLVTAVQKLIQLLDDADSTVREAAALSLGKIGGQEARRALEATVQSSDDRLAQAAEEALDELTFNSETLNPTLIDYHGSPSKNSAGLTIGVDDGLYDEAEEYADFDEDDVLDGEDRFDFDIEDEDPYWGDQGEDEGADNLGWP